VSKERAQRRAEREQEAAVKAAARAREAERRARAAARKRTLTGWLPRPHVLPGTLAARRRREVAATIAVLVALNLLVWIVRPDWQARLAALVVSVLVAPILHLFIRRP
jgi:Flp pilus assembly protein TadB